MMLSSETVSFSCEQFIWGKIIQEGRDVSGYKTVAQSDGLSEKDFTEILSRTGAGVSQAVVQGRRAYALFHLPDKRVVFSCTQRSPKPEHQRYYLQTHFLVCEWDAFEAIHADLFFLAKQIGEIPIFEQDENLERLNAAYPISIPYENDLREIIGQYPDEFLENTYRALKGKNPVAIFDSSKIDQKVLKFFQLLIHLTPKAEQPHLTFASLASGAEQGKYKFKVNPTGVLKLPHIVIRLDDKKVVPEKLVNELPLNGIFNFQANVKEIRGDIRSDTTR